MRRDLQVVVVLVLLTVGVFWPVGGHDFVNYDDTDYVTRNPIVQAGLTSKGFAWAFGTLHGEATYWHPLTWLSHMLDCELFGLRPAGHHWVNLFFHTANTVLLFLVFQRMTGARWRSAMLAALFAVHPLQVETVAWVAERKNVLSTFFWMLTLGAYLRYAEKPGLGRYAVILPCFALGLMAKPMLVTLPCVLLLLDFWPLRRFAFSPPAGTGEFDAPSRFAPGTTAALLLEKAPLFALAVATGVITILAHHGLGMTNFDYGITLDMRLDNAFVSYARYVGKTLWPAGLSVLYIRPGKWPGWTSGLCLLALIVGSGLVLRDARRWPFLSVGWLWFLGTLTPVIGLIQVGVQAMANRFAYVPVIGLFLMGTWGAAGWLARWPQHRVLAGGVSAAVLAACAFLSSLHLRHWSNSEKLFRYTLEIDPKNFVAHNNLAFGYITAGKLDLALGHALEALRLRKDFPEAQYQAGLVLDAQQKAAEAIPYFQTAIRLAPKWALPRLGLARALVREGKLDVATEEFFAGLRLLPSDADARSELAVLLSRQNRTAEAVAQYRETLSQKPDWPEVLNNLAWLFATHPRPEFRDGAEAVRLAERACEITGRKRALFLGTLAAAYAEAGRFDDAIRDAELARDLAQAAGETNVAETNRKLLALYRAGKAHREEVKP